jgi:hypothetical protein
MTIPPHWKYFQKIAGSYRKAGIGLMQSLASLENSIVCRMAMLRHASQSSQKLELKAESKMDSIIFFFEP